MKVVILAGGYGTRLSEETVIKPKPLVEIGEVPILIHIMRNYAYFGFNEFIILLGYKGFLIKEYFFNYFYNTNDFKIDLASNQVEILNKYNLDWKVSLIDTGKDTKTGGRIKRAKNIIGNKPFLMTYGDGLGNIDIKKSIDFHFSKNKLLTLTAVQIEGRYGALSLNENSLVNEFVEKPKGDGSWINGGYFVCNPGIFDLIKDDQTVFEDYPLSELAKNNNLAAWKHNGFWKAMDTIRDKQYLNDLWNNGKRPWVNK